MSSRSSHESARSKYDAARANRHRGKEAEPSDNLVAARPDYYADARTMTESVRRVYRSMRATYPPYGLVDTRGRGVAVPEGQSLSWTRLEVAMVCTVRLAFNEANPGVQACPYIGALGNLTTMGLKPAAGASDEVNRLREIVTVGAQLAPATVVNTVKRFDAMARIHKATSGAEALARNSKTLLAEPLSHPQQWATAFIFCLASNVGDATRPGIDREDFLSDERIAKLTKLERAEDGRERIVWAIPTEDFTLLSDVRVVNRLLGSETDLLNPNVQEYAAGTRLGDIAINEPVIGCPGFGLAYEMWDQAIDFAVGENKWDLG